MGQPKAMSTKPKCGAKTDHGPCKLAAGQGTDHSGSGYCKHHTGATPNGQKHAARQVAETLAIAMAGKRDIGPEEALLEAVRVQYGMVEWARSRVATLENDSAYGPVGGGKDSDPRYEPHVLIRLRGEEEDRLVKLIKTCHDIGIAERQVRLAEHYGAQLAAFAQGLLEDFGLMDDPRAPEIVRRRLLALASIDGTATERTPA